MYYEELPKNFRYILQSWDTANKNGDGNDYSVCTTWGLCKKNFYLLDVYRKRMNYPQLKRAATELWNRFKPTKLLIEDKSSGTSLIQELKSAGLYSIEAYVPPPGSDKFFRTSAQSVKFENGRVFLPKWASWLDDYIREITAFPGGKYDDQVDSTSQALEFLDQKCRLTIYDVV